MKTLFELKNNVKTVGDHLAALDTQITEKAVDPETTREDLERLKTSRDDMQARFNLLKEKHDEMEKAQKASFQAVQRQVIAHEHDPKARMKAAKAELYRATARQRPLSEEAKAILGDQNNTGGEKILPTTMTTELLHEPFVKNPLRNVSTFTNVTNLEIPKVSFQLDDDDFIADTETAKELKTEGNVLTFGRHKFKVMAPLSETILAATDTNLVQMVDQALESGVAAKEKKVAFEQKPKASEEHMSFYATGIKEVTGSDKYKAIKAAIADLHEDYRDNAKVVMRYQDYSDIIEVLANQNATLYGAPPETVLGKPVEFSDSAVDPIVGDFTYSHYNYDPQVLYDRDKDVKTGIELFVITAWFDHQIKLKSAFRIAKVNATP
ncbi:phage major capsid protein [Bacillus sp. FSL W7-1360]